MRQLFLRVVDLTNQERKARGVSTCIAYGLRARPMSNS